jgi:hypothetical protein
MIKGGTKIQGPTRNGMNRPRSVKNMRTTTENCTQYNDTGGVKFKGLNPKEEKISIPMKTYNEISRKHMIHHRMIDCFLLRDPRNPLETRDLFRQHATMTQECVLLRMRSGWGSTVHNCPKCNSESFLIRYIRPAAPTKAQHSPHAWKKLNYGGAKTQLTEPADVSAPLLPEDCKHLQEVIGVLL